MRIFQTKVVQEIKTCTLYGIILPFVIYCGKIVYSHLTTIMASHHYYMCGSGKLSRLRIGASRRFL
jgi:hypothetical protein